MGRTTTEGLRFFLTIYSSLSRYLSSYNLGSLSSQRIRLESELNGEETLVRVEIKGFGNLRSRRNLSAGGVSRFIVGAMLGETIVEQKERSDFARRAVSS